MRHFDDAVQEIQRDIDYAVEWFGLDGEIVPHKDEIRFFVEYCIAALMSLPEDLRPLVDATFVPDYTNDMLGAYLLLEQGSIYVMSIEEPGEPWRPVDGGSYGTGFWTRPPVQERRDAHDSMLANIAKRQGRGTNIKPLKDVLTDQQMDELKDARDWREERHFYLYVGSVPHPWTA